MQLGSFGKCVSKLCVVAWQVSLIRFLSGSRRCLVVELLFVLSSPPALGASVLVAVSCRCSCVGSGCCACGCCCEGCCVACVGVLWASDSRAFASWSV